MTVASARAWMRQAAIVVRRVIGVPDYDRYLEHLRECHPDIAPMTRDDFTRERMSNRYERPGSRCC